MTFPTDLQDRWQHTDPEIRLQALDDLETSATGASMSTAAQEIFVQIASTDSDNRVRNAAAHKVTDTNLLDQLCHLIRQKDKAVYKFCKEKLNAIHQLHAQQAAEAARALQVCKSLEALASKVIGPLTGAQYQYQLSQWQECSHAGNDELPRINFGTFGPDHLAILVRRYLDEGRHLQGFLLGDSNIFELLVLEISVHFWCQVFWYSGYKVAVALPQRQKIANLPQRKPGCTGHSKCLGMNASIAACEYGVKLCA